MGHPTRACLASIAAAVVLGGTAAAPVAQAPAAAPAPTAPPATPAPAPARSSIGFYVIQRTEQAWTVMDPLAVERVPGGPIRRSYSITIRRNLLNGGPPQPGYVRTLNEYDCDARRFRWRTFTIYNRFGAVVVKQDNADPTFGPPDQGGEDDTSLRVVCEGAGGGSVVAAPSLAQLVIGLMAAWDEATMAASLQQIEPPPQPAKAAPKKAAPKKPAAKAPAPKAPKTPA